MYRFGKSGCTEMNLYRQEKFFLKAKRELKVHRSRGDGALFCWIKVKRVGGGRRVYPWALLQGITLLVPDREGERQSIGASCHLSISPLQVLFILLFFSFSCLHKLFFLQPFCLSKLFTSHCQPVLLLWKLERRDDECPQNCSSLSLSLFLSSGCQSYRCHFSFTVQ